MGSTILTAIGAVSFFYGAESFRKAAMRQDAAAAALSVLYAALAFFCIFLADYLHRSWQ